MNILIVDDNTALATLLLDLCRRWTYPADVAHCGGEALKCLAHKAYDLILLDICLPDIAADQLIAQIRFTGVETPIVTMTGYNDRELETRIRRLGIVYYLIKPFEFKDLKAIIEHLALRKKQFAGAARAPAGAFQT